MEEQKFSSWAIVEVMGHSRFAGFVSEQAIGGCSFVRVDVPEVPAVMNGDRLIEESRPAFTKLLGQGSIFAITPCTEATAREAARQFHTRPISMFEMPMVRSIGHHDDDDDFDD
jgi:hypothetical protein